ncbi:MAG: hypothetical protein AAFP04_04215 [Myxococcota bacterium]
MSVIRGMIQRAERMWEITRFERVARTGTYRDIRRDHEVLLNYARSLASPASSAPHLRSSNLGSVERRFEAYARGVERALYRCLEGTSPVGNTVANLRERRGRVDELLQRLSRCELDSDTFGRLAAQTRREIDDLVTREERILMPQSVEFLTEEDYQQLGPRYHAEDEEQIERLSA